MEPRDRLWTPQKGKAEVYVLYQRGHGCVNLSQVPASWPMGLHNRKWPARARHPHSTNRYTVRRDSGPENPRRRNGARRATVWIGRGPGRRREARCGERVC